MDQQSFFQNKLIRKIIRNKKGAMTKADYMKTVEVLIEVPDNQKTQHGRYLAKEFKVLQFDRISQS